MSFYESVNQFKVVESLIQTIAQPYRVMVRRAYIKLQIKDTDSEMAAGLTYVTHQKNFTYVTRQLTYVTHQLNLCDHQDNSFCLSAGSPKKQRGEFQPHRKNHMKRVGRVVRYFDKSGEGEGTVVYKCFQ